MALTEPTKAVVWEDSGASCMARVVGNDGDAITQAGVTSIAYQVFDIDSATPDTKVNASTAMVVADTVFDTLQTDDRWTEDATGYNFLFVIPAAELPTGDHSYRVEFAWDAASGENFHVVFELTTQPLRGS